MSKDKFQRFSYRNVQICFMKKYWFGASEQRKHTSSPSLFRSTSPSLKPSLFIS